MRRRAVHQQRERDIFLAFILNTAFALIEAVGGVFTNSLAIVSNALHDVGDSISLLSAYVSERTSHRLSDERRTFGYRRLSLLAAFVNANILFTGSLLVLTKALPRVWDPEPVHSPGMLMLSALGILFNVLGVVRLSRGSSLSERVLRWHLWEDVLGWRGCRPRSLLRGLRDFFVRIRALLPSTIFISGRLMGNRTSCRLMWCKGLPSHDLNFSVH